MLELKELSPRDYQEKIADTAIKNSCLVVLPTGLGKTACAMLVTLNRLNKHKGSQILLLAPTKPLANQHYQTFKKHIKGLDEEFFTLITGEINPKERGLIWNSASIIFSTPQCAANDIRSGKLNLDNFSLLIEDEAHRCLKNYDYTFVALSYKQQAENHHTLGLTASPGSDKETINQICKNLGIKSVEVRTRESEDVKKYIEELESEIVKVDLPKEFEEIRIILKNILEKKTEELRRRGLLYNKVVTKTTLIALQAKLIKITSSGNKHFQFLKGMSLLAEILKMYHALELLETQTLHSVKKYIENLKKEEKAGKSKAIKNIFANKEFLEAIKKIDKLYEKEIEHPKLIMLLEIMKKENSSNNKKTIIFAQYRDTVEIICKKLNGLKIKSKVFVGQRGDSGLSQKEQHEIIEEFSNGELDCIVSTSIGEEGLDIPEVSTVVFYESTPSAIRKIQRTGRTARLKPGKVITMMTKKTRDESYHWAAHNKEKKMYGALDKIKQDFKQKEQKQQLNLNDF